MHSAKYLIYTFYHISYGIKIVYQVNILLSIYGCQETVSTLCNDSIAFLCKPREPERYTDCHMV